MQGLNAYTDCTIEQKTVVVIVMKMLVVERPPPCLTGTVMIPKNAVKQWKTALIVCK